MLKAVICDLDETLIYAKAAHEGSLIEAMKTCGHPVKKIKWVYGLIVEQLIKLNLPNASPSEIKRIAETKACLLHKYLKYAKKLPGAEPLLRYLEKSKVKCVLITNNNNHDLIVLLKKLGWINYFDIILDRESGPSKPNPKLLNLAVSKLGIEKDEAIYLGDSDSDLIASERAGIDIILNRQVHSETECTNFAEYIVADLNGAKKIIMDMVEK